MLFQPSFNTVSISIQISTKELKLNSHIILQLSKRYFCQFFGEIKTLSVFIFFHIVLIQSIFFTFFNCGFQRNSQYFSFIFLFFYFPFLLFYFLLILYYLTMLKFMSLTNIILLLHIFFLIFILFFSVSSRFCITNTSSFVFIVSSSFLFRFLLAFLIFSIS